MLSQTELENEYFVGGVPWGLGLTGTSPGVPGWPSGEEDNFTFGPAFCPGCRFPGDTCNARGFTAAAEGDDSDILGECLEGSESGSDGSKGATEASDSCCFELDALGTNFPDSKVA